MWANSPSFLNSLLLRMMLRRVVDSQAPGCQTACVDYGVEEGVSGQVRMLSAQDFCRLRMRKGEVRLVPVSLAIKSSSAGRRASAVMRRRGGLSFAPNVCVLRGESFGSRYLACLVLRVFTLRMAVVAFGTPGW